MAITAETRSDIIELVVAAYDAAPGTTLLTELVAIIDGGGTLADVAVELTTRTEWTTEYPSFQTANEFATEWLGKLVPEASAASLAEGITIAEGLINGGASFADVLMVAQDFLSNLAEDDAFFGSSAALFNNKVEVAAHHTITLEEVNQSAAALVSVTSDDATVTTAKAAADAAALPPADAGASYTLLTSLDSKTMGSGDDSAFAVDSTTAASDTFNVSDAVDGSTGTDTFYLTIDSIAAPTTYTPSRIDNFEKFSVTNVDATPDAVTINANLLGINSVEVSASTAGVNFTNITAGSAISLIGNTAAVDIQHKNAGLTGSADSVTVSMVGNTGNVTIDSDGAQDIESATLSVEGVNTGNYTIGDSSASTVTSVTVTGTGSIDLEAGGDLNTALETLDASANSGGVTFTSSIATGTTLTGGSGNDVLTGATGNDVLTGGEGNDTLTITAGKDNISGGAGDDVVVANGADKDDTIAGGDGTDTLSINAALAYDDESTPTVNDAANISGFETLRNEAAITQDMAALPGIVAIEGESGVLTATESGVIADYYALANSVGLDVTLATASNTTADNINIHIGEATAQANATGVTVDAIQYETALIDSKGADGNTVTDFEADALTKLTVTGNKSLSVTLNDSTAVSTLPLTTVDASAFTGSSLTVSAVEADSGVTITTGSSALVATVGDGTNSVTGTIGDDTITTGSGADTISTSDGEDTITAGDGANTITVGAGNATITGGEGVDTVTAGNGNNNITLGDGADVVTAGTGNNTITNAAGNATITAGDGANTVTNTAGNSTITLGDGGNTVNLTAGNSTVVTGDLADDINITAGNNDITSGAGNDTISLGSGNDTVDAGTGTDAVDFSVSSGTWTGSISNAETVAVSFTGSAKVDTAGISGYTTLTVAAADDTVTTTVNNLGSATLNLSDDSVESGGTGDLEALVIDTTDDAEITLNLGANLNAATSVASVLGSVTITDADAVTLKSNGGGFGNLIVNDFEGIALDDAETTSLTVEAGSDYTSLATADITGTEGVTSITLDASGSESDIEVDAIADATNLSALSITGSGLNSQVELGIVGNEASTTDAILTSFTVTASNNADIDFAGTTDNELGDINTAEDMDTLKLSASGTGSTITAGEVFADGLTVTSVELEASAGGVIDMETVADAAVLNYGYESLNLEATGVGSSLTIGNFAQDAGSLAVTAEANITVEAEDYATIAFGAEGEIGGVDLDSVHIGVGNGATLSGTETTLTASGDITNLDIDLDANSTITGQMDITTGKILGTLSIDIGDEAAVATESFLIELSDDVDAEIGIKTLNINIADQDGSAIAVDLETAGVIDVGGNDLVDIDDSGEDGSTYYNGEITLAGDDDNTVMIGTSGLLDTALPTAGSDSVYGAWDVDTGDGADTITGGEGSDTIDSTGGADSVSGADGNDVLTVGNGADTVSGGAGNDSIILTEAVSSADVVQFSSVVGASSDSAEVAAASGFIDSGQDTITTFTAGVDTIQITATSVADFVHGTDTDLGEGDATSEGDDSNSYATNVGLINMDGGTADEFGDAGDILFNFSSPTTTMTEALLEAALQYNLTGAATADVITTGALADTIDGGNGNDTIIGGAGADNITGNEGADSLTGGTGIDTFVFDATAAGNGIDIVTDFDAEGETGDILDLTNFITVAEANIDFITDNEEADAMADNHIFDLGLEASITSKDYEAGDFSDIFGEGAGATNAFDVESGANGDAVIIVRGDDVTQVLYYTDDGAGDVAAGNLTLVAKITAVSGVLDGETGFDKTDNFLDT